MSELQIRPADAPLSKTWRILLYGPPGSGKSTAAATAPGPILYLNNDGPGALRYARSLGLKFDEVPWQGKETLDSAFRTLRDGKGKYATLVVDPVSELYDDFLNSIATNNGVAPNARPQIQHHGEVLERVKRFVKAVRDLDVNLVLVAHEQPMEDEATGELRMMPLTGGKKLPTILPGTVDIVAYCRVVQKDGKPVYAGQLLADDTRIGKDRSNVLGAMRPLNLSEWIKTANGGGK